MIRQGCYHELVEFDAWAAARHARAGERGLALAA
jgi:hypothetical protein